MEFRFEPRQENKYPYKDSDDRSHQHSPCSDVFYFPDRRMHAGRNKIRDHFNGGVEQFGNKHQPDRQEKRHPIAVADVEKNSRPDNDSGCYKMNAEIMLLRQRMTKPVKGMHERTCARGERKFFVLWIAGFQ